MVDELNIRPTQEKNISKFSFTHEEHFQQIFFAHEEGHGSKADTITNGQEHAVGFEDWSPLLKTDKSPDKHCFYFPLMKWRGEKWSE